MTDDTEKCGSTETTTGQPCQNNANSCPWHDNKTKTPDTGRPTKLSYERQEQIATDLEAGKSLNSAARKAGVTPQTVYNWIDRGEADKEAGKDNEYVEFLERITRAKGHGEDFYFNLALELARENEDHRFIASLMKQRYPDSWGETETGVESADITVTSDVVEVTEGDLTHD